MSDNDDASSIMKDSVTEEDKARACDWLKEKTNSPGAKDKYDFSQFLEVFPDEKPGKVKAVLKALVADQKLACSSSGNATFYGLSDANFAVRILAKLNGYAILIVLLLKSNAPSQVINLISKFLGVGKLIGLLGKITLLPVLEGIERLMATYGESYIMEQRVLAWKSREVTYEEILSSVEGIPCVVCNEDYRTEAISLLMKYYSASDNNEGKAASPAESQEQTGNTCLVCHAVIAPHAKFCSECGAKLLLECRECGHRLETSMKFCPECGAKV